VEASSATLNALRTLAMARDAGALTLIDGAQSVPRLPVDVRKLKCDFLAWSAHKMLGPTGIGALYIDDTRHAAFEPARVGGGMVDRVDARSHAWAAAPLRYEAGTPHIAGALGFGAAADFLLERTTPAEVYAQEKYLTDRLVDHLATIPRVRLWPARAPTRS
jgi:cysteine desulfurase / selenocysteine lyase